jgi:membrane peptidoglycan carboxypeptidase
MSYFNQKRLYSPNFNGGTYTSSRSLRGTKDNKKKIIFRLIALFGLFIVVFGFRFTRNILMDLPDVTEIKDMVFSEATVIQDRNGETLYRLYEENRQYVVYS